MTTDSHFPPERRAEARVRCEMSARTPAPDGLLLADLAPALAELDRQDVVIGRLEGEVARLRAALRR